MGPAAEEHLEGRAYPLHTPLVLPRVTFCALSTSNKQHTERPKVCAKRRCAVPRDVVNSAHQ